MVSKSLAAASAFVVLLGLVASCAYAQNQDQASGQQLQNQATSQVVFESFPLVKTLTCSTNRDCQAGEVCINHRCALLAGQLLIQQGGQGTGASASINLGGVGASASAGTSGTGAQIGVSPAIKVSPAAAGGVLLGGAVVALLAL